MFAYEVLFRCPKCGFEKKYIVGDCLSFGDTKKNCPKCNSKMMKKKFIKKH